MSLTLHAGCILLGDGGLLIQGASGSGKSALAQGLLARWQAAGRFARLVGDDRILVEQRHGRLLARPHARIAGLAEVRGLGLVKMSHEPACILRACVELGAGPGERLPDSNSLFRTIEGVRLPCAAIFSNAWIVDRVETFWLQAYL